MGSSFSCICDPSSTIKRQVLVMKEDGKLLKFKEGIRVKDILEAYPYHKIIRCCSDRTELPEPFQLSCDQLYFLLPRGLALHNETYHKLLRLAASGNPKYSVVCSGRNYANFPMDNTTKTDQVVLVVNKDITSSSYDDSWCYNSRWKPALQIIPQVKSSPTLYSSME